MVVVTFVMRPLVYTVLCLRASISSLLSFHAHFTEDFFRGLSP